MTVDASRKRIGNDDQAAVRPRYQKSASSIVLCLANDPLSIQVCYRNCEMSQILLSNTSGNFAAGEI